MPRGDNRKQRLDNSERLATLEEFRALTEKEKEIALEHVVSPALNVMALAQKLGCSQAVVYKFFHSTNWEVINRELAKQGLRELTQLAVHTVRDVMMKSRDSVRLQAAVSILKNDELIKDAPRSVKNNNKMILMWGEEAEKVKQLQAAAQMVETQEAAVPEVAA